MCIISELTTLSPQKKCLSIYYNTTVDGNLCEKWPYFGTTPLLLVKVEFLLKTDSGYPKMNFLCINRILLPMCINLRVWKIRQSNTLHTAARVTGRQGERKRENPRTRCSREKEHAWMCVCMHTYLYAWVHAYDVCTNYMNVLFVCMYVLTCVDGQVNSTPLRSCQSFISMTPTEIPLLAPRYYSKTGFSD